VHINKQIIFQHCWTNSLLPMTQSEQTDRARQGLTEHTAQSKTSLSKVERNSTHTHHWLWKLKMNVHVLLWLELMYQGSKFRSGTHTPKAHFSYTRSVTHPTARTQDNSTCLPFPAGANGFSTRGSLLFLLHRSIPLTQVACSPMVHICHHKCLRHVYVETTQDVTVKKGMWRC
jgi:hypothetical protein